MAQQAEGFVPGNHPIDAYGSGGFRFAGMSHQGSVIVTALGVYAWSATMPSEITPESLKPVFAAPKGSIELLLVGTGPDLIRLSAPLQARLKGAGIRFDPMSTSAAARTYNVLAGEGRRVAAALIAVA